MLATAHALHRLLLFAILALALIVSSHPAFAATASEVSVEDVFGTNYLRVVQQEIQAATGAVVVAMFEIRVPQDAAEENPSLVLVNELLNAHRRGVDVDVILNLRSKYDPESDDPVRDHANGIAADMLTYAGVDVAYFPGSYHMHQKLVIVDEKTTIIGSHIRPPSSTTCITPGGVDSELCQPIPASISTGSSICCCADGEFRQSPD
jgi:hypothetical protein